MTKQKWREKAEKFIDEYPRDADFLPVRMAEAIPDLGEHFYSLHLQEVEKIRKKILKMTQSGMCECPKGVTYCSHYGYNQAIDHIDDILLAITDEK